MGNSLFHHRRGVLLLALVGIVLGVLLAGRLPVKLYPATTKPNVGVMVPHPGFTAADFRSEYGEQIESRLSGLENVDEVEGNYRSGRTRYRIGFGWNVDSEEGRREVETAMAALRGTLPQAARDYNVYAWRAGNPGFLAVAVYSSEVGPRQLYDIIEPVLTPSLDRVEDAESIDLVRVRDLQAEVTLQPDRLLAADLDLGEVVQAVEQGYRPISLGSVQDGSESTNVRVKQDVPSVFEIGDIVVSSRGASETRLDDIAEVVVRWGLPRQLFRANGERSVLLFATPKEGGNVREMSNDVRAAVEQADLPEHVAFDFLVDPAAFIDNAVQGVTRSALLGALLALCAIVLLLGEGRNSFIIALSIPLTIVLTFILMYLFEISINLISLGGTSG
jgi:multidrug efflux pump subunit AcrB